LILPWLTLLRQSLADEGADRPWIGALASDDEKHHPHVRHVICRQVDDDGTVWIASDARSEKNRQIRANATVEIAFWLPSQRQQYRIAGEAQIFGAGHDHPLRETMWRGFTDLTRALFHWPQPAAPRADGERAFVAGVKDYVPVPETLELISIRPIQIDLLELSYFPHRRRRWRAHAQWNVEELNP